METIHIVPVGLDSPERFIEGFKKYPPSKVLFVVGDRENPDELAAREIMSKVEGLMGSYEERETVTIDLFTFSAALRGFFDLIKKHDKKGATFFINVSSNTKIVNQAAYMAAALSKANVRLYYVKAGDYLSTQLLTLVQKGKGKKLGKFIEDLTEKGTVYLSNGAKEVVEIPVLKMKRPLKEDLAVLTKIKDNKGTISSTAKLIRNLENVQPKKKISTSLRNKYSKRVMRMKNAGFIEQELEGVSKKLILTDSGKVVAEIGDLLNGH